MNFLDFIGFIITMVAMLFLFLRRMREKNEVKPPPEPVLEEVPIQIVKTPKPKIKAKTYANYGKNSNDDIPKRNRVEYVKLSPKQMVIHKEIIGKPKGLDF